MLCLRPGVLAAGTEMGISLAGPRAIKLGRQPWSATGRAQRTRREATGQVQEWNHSGSALSPWKPLPLCIFPKFFKSQGCQHRAETVCR